MDPNYIKLYKMAQLTIEYLLVRFIILVFTLIEYLFFQLCQDQITNQFVDFEQIKGKSVSVRFLYLYEICSG